ncbi:hypothetical protein V8F06_003681 [Rhypophila decipiens]
MGSFVISTFFVIMGTIYQLEGILTEKQRIWVWVGRNRNGIRTTRKFYNGQPKKQTSGIFSKDTHRWILFHQTRAFCSTWDWVKDFPSSPFCYSALLNLTFIYLSLFYGLVAMRGRGEGGRDSKAAPSCVGLVRPACGSNLVLDPDRTESSYEEFGTENPYFRVLSSSLFLAGRLI